VGAHLAFGLAAVAGVVVFGDVVANRSTREAMQDVRSMQADYAPLVHRTGDILEKLAGYDRAVAEHLEASGNSHNTVLNNADTALAAALAAYSAAPAVPGSAGSAAVESLSERIAAHVARGRELAQRAGQRAEWIQRRHSLLDAVNRRIRSAGGSGLAVGETEVIARRSLADLASAMNVLLASPDNGAARAEKEFTATVHRHEDELMRSPGPAWLGLVRDDSREATHLREHIEHFDAESAATWSEFLTEGATLMAQVQEQLQEPARITLVAAAQRAADAAGEAERTFNLTGASVMGLVLLVSVLLALSITLPVRRLTAATQRLAGGHRDVRAQRGGMAEFDQLALSFNTMADQIAAVEHELRTHQARLEDHVAQRTRQLRHIAYHDPLTRLPNRRQLNVQLSAALSRAELANGRVALMFVDLDNFKSINDTLGHTFGDRVLQAISERLRRAAGPDAFIARLGGDEFTVLLEGGAAASLRERADGLIERLQQPLVVDGRVLSTSASAGAALYPEHARSAEALLRAADVALYRAKDLGRNRFALYSAELAEAAAEHFRLEQALRRAVEAGELALLYQPQISLHTASATGVEALLRWRRPDGRLIAAAEFIPIAEKSGLMRELTAWVLKVATSTVKTWRTQGWHHASVAINVSPLQLLEPDFVHRVIEALDSAGLPASALELELTETVLQTGAATVAALRRLRELGVAIALDDFGSGYSSLTSLEQLPISRVKLDRMLIERIDTNPRSAAIARSIIALCHGLGLQVVAEGVERSGQLEFLAQCGPVSVQGFLLAAPSDMNVAPREAETAAARVRELIRRQGTLETEAEVADQGALVFVNAPSRRTPPR